MNRKEKSREHRNSIRDHILNVFTSSLERTKDLQVSADAANESIAIMMKSCPQDKILIQSAGERANEVINATLKRILPQ